MIEVREEFVPHGNLPLIKEEQRELFNPDFTVEANLVKYSAVFPPHSPETPLYSTKHIDALSAIGGGGIIVTQLTTSTSPISNKGKVEQDRVPGDFEKKVFYAIVSIWVTNGKPSDGIVQFSIGKLIEQLGLSSGGKNYKMVKEAISRISRSTIKIEGSYVSAPDFRKDTREFSLFADCQESQSRRGRKSLNGNIETDFYRIRLNTAIVSNMIHDYSIVIQVKDYTSASSKYYRRLVDIIEFEFQKGSGQGRDKIEFLLSQLAKNLPLEGDAANVSTILKRLSTSLRELVELGGYQYDVTKVDNNAILTIFSKSYMKTLKQQKSFDESIQEYLDIHQKLFSKSLAATIFESEKAIMDFLTADEAMIEYGGRQFYRTIHLFDVLMFQYFIRNNKKRLKDWASAHEERGSILRIARSILNGSNPLKYPDGYKTHFERLRESEALVSKNHLEAQEINRTQNATQEAQRQAQTLYRELNTSGLNHYMKRIREEFPKLGEEVIRSEKLLSDTIMEDILDGSLNRAHFKNLQPHSEKLGISS
jgi:hypothetical protein